MDMGEIERIEMEIDPRVVQAAMSAGLLPMDVDWHLEAIHGWEPHDPGYIEKGLTGTIECLKKGGCTNGR